MDLEMVLNELSLRTPAPDIPTARQWMTELIQTLRTATSSGVKRVVRTQDDMNSIQLAPEYPLAKWRNDPTVNREERSFFRMRWAIATAVAKYSAKRGLVSKFPYYFCLWVICLSFWVNLGNHSISL